MQLKKLSDGFGLAAGGIDHPFQEIWEAFFAAQVLVFRNQSLTPARFLEFARRFGRPEPHVIDQFHHPEHADILILSNVQKDGLEQQIARAGKERILAYHICDWPVPTRDLLNDRGMMGDGVIDLPRIRGWVEAAGYSGFQEVEIFSEPDWWRRDPDEVLRAMKDCHQRAS